MNDLKNIMKKYISNLNTVSALFDRLITEKIKQYFFYLSKENKKFKAQNTTYKFFT